MAIASLLADKAKDILIWEHKPTFLKNLCEQRSNPLLLPGIILPDCVSFCGSFEDVALFKPELLILATPSQFLGSTLRALNQSLGDKYHGFWVDEHLSAVVNLAKGIEEHSLKCMSEIIADAMPSEARHKICCLSGPSHAEEVARRIPTAVVIAGNQSEILIMLQKLFSNEYFRVYRSDDLIGVQIGGAVKNVIAIAAGIIDGLGFGDNTKGALITRGIAEILRLGIAMGAKTETFLGLSGIGDLVTTAISTHSRNRKVGFEIGKGKSLKTIVEEMKMVAEGVASTAGVHELAQKYSVEMPITACVYEVLYNGKSAEKALKELMTRDLKPE